MNKNHKLIINKCFYALETKNIKQLISCFDIDAEFIDPHYPNINMQGKDKIIEGMLWSFKNLKKFKFSINRYYKEEGGNKFIVEATTKHELHNGKKLDFPQIFVFKLKNNKIIFLQAYEPYGPHGVLNIILMWTRLKNKINFRFLAS